MLIHILFVYGYLATLFAEVEKHFFYENIRMININLNFFKQLNHQIQEIPI